jgi:hypothetical protein
MKITEENKNELFIEFCDMEANEEMCISKDAFKEALTKALTLYSVVDSKRFTKTDLLNGYQAGCIENHYGTPITSMEDFKEIKEDGKKWVKRYTE